MTTILDGNTDTSAAYYFESFGAVVSFHINFGSRQYAVLYCCRFFYRDISQGQATSAAEFLRQPYSCIFCTWLRHCYSKITATNLPLLVASELFSITRRS